MGAILFGRPGRLAAALGALALSAAIPATAQAPSPRGAASAIATDVEAIVAQIEEFVRADYVDAGKRPAVLAVLAEGRRSGRYAATDSPDALAVLVTEDLKRASQDGHMYMRWRPDQHRALIAARTVAPVDGAAADDALFGARARRANAGLETLRILGGNVRYVKISGFLWDGATSPVAYDAALAFLKGGDAVIIDLRGNGGGSPEAVNYLVSHFVPANTRLMTFVMAGGEEPSISRETPTGRLSERPVYVLTDRGVGSAAEEFALHVDKFRFGELVGETTGGAGNRNQLYPVGDGFVLSVSVGLARHGTDGSGWEGTGVKPHVAAPGERALDVAHARALDRLATEGSPAHRSEYAWAAEAVRARADPPVVDAAALARFAGVYGERTVTLEGGALAYQRAGGPKLRLTPLGRDRFQIAEDEAVRVSFEFRDGRAVAAVVTRREGQRSRYERTG